MDIDTIFLFPPFRLDLRNGQLWRDAQALALRPKTFAVLQYLVARAGQLVTQDALLDAIWGPMAVSDTVVRRSIRELRITLGDTAQHPQFIQTVHRRGYRFIRPVTSTSAPEARPEGTSCVQLGPAISHGAHVAVHRPVPVVGRERELAQLHQWLATALGGSRQIVMVTGEAGLGKTTLVDAFCAGLRTQDIWCGHGQCLEHFGSGEAYLPVFEALGRLCRGPEGQALVEILTQWAPTWLVHMPGLCRPGDLEALHHRVLGATQERMLRELADAIDVLTAVRPLVLILEDLHWSDYATLDWLAALARRREPARLLVLGTYRPADVRMRDHPLQTVKHELVAHGQCVELPLTLFDEAAVAAYLTARFPGSPLPAGLAQGVHQRTDGNPLFMVHLVQEWLHQGWVREDAGQVGWRGGLTELLAGIPETLRQMLDAQLDRLSAEEQRVLEASSVAGVAFSAAAVAAGCATTAIEIEACCAGLARRSPWLQTSGEQVWPDRTVAGCYQFAHVLYQEVAYNRVTPARRVRLHQQIGQRLEAGYGAQTSEVATELARHFEQAGDMQRAVAYLRQAAETAQGRYAPADAIPHLTKALTLLARWPDTAERAQQELTLQAALGPALMAVQGYAAPAVAHAYARARELCQAIGETPQLFEVLLGLCIFYQERAELQTAYALAEQLLHLAQRRQDPLRLLWAHNMLGFTLHLMGEFVQARVHLEESLTLYRLHTPRTTGFVFDPGVDCLCQLTTLLYVLGYPDQALQRSQEAIALARELSHPYSLTEALSYAARIHRWRGELQAARALEATNLEICRTQGFTQSTAQETILQGWDRVRQGQGETGIAQMGQGLEALRATGAEIELPWLLGILARAYVTMGQAETGLARLAEAFAIVERTGKHLDTAALYRCKADALCALAAAGHSCTARDGELEVEAEACLHRALAIARHQHAKSFELQAALSLSRLWQQQGKRAAARALLAEVSGWFTEGFNTANLQEARVLLEALREQPDPQ